MPRISAARADFVRRNTQQLRTAKVEAKLAVRFAKDAKEEADRYERAPDSYSPRASRVVDAEKVAASQLSEARASLEGLNLLYSKIGASPYWTEADSHEVRDMRWYLKDRIAEAEGTLSDARLLKARGDSKRDTSPEPVSVSRNRSNLERLGGDAQRSSLQAEAAVHDYARYAQHAYDEPERFPPMSPDHDVRRRRATDSIRTATAALEGVRYFRDTRQLYEPPTSGELLDRQLGLTRLPAEPRPYETEVEELRSRTFTQVQRVQRADGRLYEVRTRTTLNYGQ